MNKEFIVFVFFAVSNNKFNVFFSHYQTNIVILAKNNPFV